MASKSLTPTRYTGKVCDKHPEWNGLRKISNSKCVQCQSEYIVKWKKTNSAAMSVSRSKYYRVHKDIENARGCEWSKDNPGTRNAKTAKHRAAKRNQVPVWADLSAIREVYRQARARGLTVDHVIPLQGKLVSGLHVHNNLQLLPASENFSKCNTFNME